MPLRRNLGLTLTEIMVALAVLAVLGVIAIPGFGARLDRERLRGAAEGLATDLNEARFEAARQGRALHLITVDGPAWCWAVATTRDCPCGSGQGCQLRSVGQHDHPGVALRTPGHVEVGADGRTETTAAAFDLQSARGLQLRVSLSSMGRAQVCTLRGPGSGAAAAQRYPPCAAGS
jgi:prepilin-type N-terminal cleavage/methylation domain-containing protein